MAQGKLSPIFEGVHGRIGDLVVKQYGSKVVYTRRPDFRNRIFSERQLASQERFREAEMYARELMLDPIVRKLYEEEARAKGKTARGLMIADFLHAGPPPGAVEAGRRASRNQCPYTLRSINSRLRDGARLVQQ